MPCFEKQLSGEGAKVVYNLVSLVALLFRDVQSSVSWDAQNMLV